MLVKFALFPPPVKFVLLSLNDLGGDVLVALIGSNDEVKTIDATGLNNEIVDASWKICKAEYNTLLHCPDGAGVNIGFTFMLLLLLNSIL